MKILEFEIGDYKEIWEKMIEFTATRTRDTLDELWITEHNPIYTLGKNANENNIIDADNIPVLRVDRGGEVTYHGPGQRIVYFMLNLNNKKKDIRKFISVIEKSIIDTLKHYNIDTFADKDNVGIWYNNNSKIEKVAAIGVRVSKWIAYHGFSLNIDNDLNKYNAIIPCGIKDKGVTNLFNIKNQNYEFIDDKIIENFTTNLKSLDV